MGNRLQKADSVHGTENYTYNAANMLLTRGIHSYTNDSNGNTLTGGGRTNTWDGQNRLTQCIYNGTTTTHTYGSDGLRRRTVEGATTTDYVLDGQGVVRTLVNNVVDRTYLHGARGPEYERIGANDPVWYLYDGLGSVLGTVDKNGNVVSTRKYDVYGAVRGSTGPSGTKHKFVGQLGHPSEDETGLVYMRARYYDPVTGRFVREDPAHHGSNWYVYAGGNPTNFIDADGRKFSLGGCLMTLGAFLCMRALDMLVGALAGMISAYVDAKVWTNGPPTGMAVAIGASGGASAGLWFGSAGSIAKVLVSLCGVPAAQGLGIGILGLVIHNKRTEQFLEETEQYISGSSTDFYIHDEGAIR